MTKQHAVKQIHLGMIPLSGNAISLGNDLILSDNFDQPSRWNPNTPLDEEGLFTYPLPTPYKQMFVYLMVCTEGEVRLRVNLEEYILHDYDVILIHPGFIIDWFRAKPGSKVAALSFNESAFVGEGNWPSLNVIRQNMLHPLLMPLKDRQVKMLLPMYNLLREICASEEFEFKQDALAGCLRILASSLAHWITVNTEDEEPLIQSRNEHLFKNFLNEVQIHCSTERKIGFYAKKFCISPKYFAKLIYDTSGRHASDWIREYVILEAKAMLRTGSYTVQEVSDALHFPNSSFFGKYFKAAVGYSPRKYAMEK
ncbi:MAG: AraC family transcriptional regulator [Bacteroidales bacterium]|nr:AraC family transcriptional regulator [Bacteroidales bacterium]